MDSKTGRQQASGFLKAPQTLNLIWWRKADSVEAFRDAPGAQFWLFGFLRTRRTSSGRARAHGCTHAQP
jgi:hypothetical protein